MAGPKIEEDILNSIPDIEDDQSTEQTTETEEQSDDAVQEAPGEEGVQESPVQQGDRRGGPQDRTTPQQRQPQQPKPSAPRGRPGDLVDPATGQVIARAGSERRLYEQSVHARRDAANMRAALQTVQNELAQTKGQLEGLSNAPTQLGLNPQEAVAGMRMFSAFKRDPVGALKFMLAEVQAQGHNVDGIAEGGVSAQAIHQMLDAKLRPLLNDREEAAQKQRAYVETDRQVETFYSQFPDARIHDDVLGALVSRDPTLTPREAYFMLRNHFMTYGYDWSKPLNANMQRAQGGQQPVPHQQQSIPNGRSAPRPNGQQRMTRADEQYAHEDESWENIIRSSMRSNGMRV